MDTKATITFFMFPIAMAPLILLLSWLKSLEHPEGFTLTLAITMSLFFLLIFSPLIYFFFNYRSADKDYYLQISKGHDEFVYGTTDNKKLYNKQYIVEINTYGVYYSKSLWRECEVFIITFENGEQIRFTSLLISGSKLRQKFPDHQITNHKKFFPRVESV